MKVVVPVLIAVSVAVVGCGLSSRAPKSQWLSDFQKADSILIQSNGHQRTVTDPQVVRRLHGIYADSNWMPYQYTLPGDIGDRTIELRLANTTLRRFSYTGSLWETESYTGNRTAELPDGDTQWIESLFEHVTEQQQATASQAAQ